LRWKEKSGNQKVDTLNTQTQRKKNGQDEVGIIIVRRKENWRNERRERENRLGVFPGQNAVSGSWVLLLTIYCFTNYRVSRLYRVDDGRMHGALFNCNLLAGVPGPLVAWEHGLTKPKKTG
jgi:hypothetical protein